MKRFRCLAFLAVGGLTAAVSAGQAVPKRSYEGAAQLPILRQSQDLGATDARQVLHIAVSLQPRVADELEQYADLVSDPQSLLYGQWLTPAQIGERFGASKADVDAVVNYLTSKGLTVTMVASNRMAVLAEGTVKQAQNAFGTEIRNFAAASPDGKETWKFHANRTPAVLPAKLADRVVDISGLEDYTRPIAHANTTKLTPTLTRALYGTSQFYVNPSLAGQGRRIGISNWDGYKLSNVDSFIDRYGLPYPAGGKHSNIQVIKIDGGSGSGRAQGEGDLDIQMEIGQAPLATIKIFDGKGGDLVNVLTREANDGAVDIISESWGWSLPASTATAAHNQHLAMTAQGITYMAASGDNGTSLEPYSYPNYEPEVLQIGGTVATVNDATGARVSEVGWSGSGGGWSTNTASFNAKPSWMTVTYPGVSDNHRWCPDVALHADGGGVGGFYFVYRGALYTGSGTSFSSPIFAGALGLAQQKLLALGKLSGNGRLGRFQDWLYSHRTTAGLFFDVTSGNNGNLPNGLASNAISGWDFVTGCGAMDFNAFVNAY